MTRSHTISTKVTEQEKDWLEKRAAASGLIPAEWYRQTLLAERDEPAALLLLAAEFRGMRSILLMMIAAYLAGQAINDAQVQNIVAVADATKYQRAQESLASLQNARPGLLPNEFRASDGTTNSR